MGFREKMHAFDQHVGGEQQIVGRAARAVNRAVVADAEDYRGSTRNRRRFPEPFGNCSLILQPSPGFPHPLPCYNCLFPGHSHVAEY
jgi:hypothetical protein